MITYITLAIFGFSFLLIIFEVFDKALIALSGAILMVMFRILTPEEAISSVDFETIILLMSMMLLVNVSSKSNIFTWINTKIAFLTKGNPLAMFVLFSTITTVFSAFLDNVTTVLLIVPLTIQLIKGMGRDPKPYIFAEIIFSNVGGALTLIGDPPNIIIGGAANLSFISFIANLWVPILMSSLFIMIIFLISNWQKLKPITSNLQELYIANILIEKIKITFLKKTLHTDFIVKAISIILLTIAGFLLEDFIHLPLFVIAITGAITLMLVTSKRENIHDAFKSVEWTTLFFFGGLFIMVAGVEKTGILSQLSNWIANSSTDLLYLSLLILWVSGFVSMILDNIPFVTIMIPVVLGITEKFSTQPDINVLWWALSLGACLGGNATSIGASANIVSIDLARKENVNISFLEYMKFSLPLTIGVLIICSIYLYFRIRII